MPNQNAGPIEVPLGMVKNYEGMPISLDLSKASFFGLGPNHHPILWLSKQNWYDTVPSGLDDEQATILSKSIADGVVVVGKQWMPPITKDTAVLQKYIDLLRAARKVDEPFKEHIRKLFLYKKEGNYTAIEIFRKMLVDENNRSNRSTFISYLKEAISNYAGPEMLVEDFPNDPDNYTVQIDPNTFEVISDTRKQKLEDTNGISILVDKDEMTQFQGLDDPEKRAAKIDSII